MAESTLSPPVDPRYEAFINGLKNIASAEAAYALFRWDHRDGKWYSWKPADWVLEDVGMSDTSPGNAMQDLSLGWGAPDWQFRDYWAPDLYAAISAAYASHRRRWPASRPVWGPWGGGDWRSAWPRPVPPGAPDQSGGWKAPGGDPSSLSLECRQRIDSVRDALRRGYIVHDAAQRLINEIVAECT